MNLYKTPFFRTSSPKERRFAQAQAAEGRDQKTQVISVNSSPGFFRFVKSMAQ